ncbi:hypothetical protein R5R35_012401 [Gryllus longicercus]|uniref:Endoplasmic reticulum lectin 1 n=2 Tax=Gryllus longicercus TaxID=2509291 RepID=A0AAN9VL44_9ORTH
MAKKHILYFVVTLFMLQIIYGIDIKGFDDTVIFKVNWPGREAKEFLEPDAETLMVRTEQNEQYMCLLPKVQEKEKNNEENYDGPNPLELLAPVFQSPSSCYYRIESFWKYELCHGRHIRQYHEEREGKKVKQQEYYLGKWDSVQQLKLYEELEKMKSSSENVPMKKIDGMNMPYLQINMTDGTICDVNKKPRFTRVLYVCYAHGKHEISSLKETSICEYEVVVLSPHLCKHPKYKPQESGENIINCHSLEGSPKKPKELLALEAESLKLKQQKISDEKLQQVFAVFSIDRSGEGQDGEPPKLRVEIHPVEVSVDTEQEPVSTPHAPPLTDTSAVNSFLSGQHCIVGGTGWWKYEFCYGVSVSQFHIEKDGTKTVLNLGKFNKEKHFEWLEKNPHKRPKAIGSRKQVSHLYSGGTICDKTGRPRQTEVKLKCSETNASPGSVALFMYEPKTCEYILGVESPFICDILPHADENGIIKYSGSSESGDEVTVSAEEEEDDEEGDDDDTQDTITDDDFDIHNNRINGGDE